MKKQKFTVICDNCGEKTSVLVNDKNDFLVLEDKNTKNFTIQSIEDKIEIECKTCHNKVYLDKIIRKVI